MEDRVKISVIMGVYNQRNKEILSAAIDSVLAQTRKDFEFIIYNDGSDSEISKILNDYAKKEPRIHYIENEVNHGLAYSLNSCIDVAKGKYLARMDDDDICDPQRLMVQYRYLEEHPEISFVGSSAFLIDEKGQWGIRKMPEYPEKQDFLRYSPYIHPTVMIRRSVFEEVEAYRATKENWRCEDYELFMRLWKLGYQGYNIQQPLFYYRENRDSYRKRKLCYRWNETCLRYRNFKKLGLLYPFGWCYVIRPMVAAVIPSGLILAVKKLYHFQDKKYARVTEKAIGTISEDFETKQEIIRSI